MTDDPRFVTPAPGEPVVDDDDPGASYSDDDRPPLPPSVASADVVTPEESEPTTAELEARAVLDAGVSPVVGPDTTAEEVEAFLIGTERETADGPEV